MVSRGRVGLSEVGTVLVSEGMEIEVKVPGGLLVQRSARVAWFLFESSSQAASFRDAQDTGVGLEFCTPDAADELIEQVANFFGEAKRAQACAGQVSNA